nr:MAG TPA: hypothetical protein [Caudoviricetes sp.]
MKTRLKFAPSSSAHVVHYDSPRGVSLVSYATRVIDLVFDTDTPEPVLKVRGTWSITTQKHMRAFVREYVDADPDAVMRGILAVTRTACRAYQLTSVRIEYDPTMPTRY